MLGEMSLKLHAPSAPNAMNNAEDSSDEPHTILFTDTSEVFSPAHPDHNIRADRQAGR